jgi:hypothetical protein
MLWQMMATQASDFSMDFGKVTLPRRTVANPNLAKRHELQLVIEA